MKNGILCIDAQNDFCNPESDMYVPGADGDMKKVAEFIKLNKEKIDGIALTLHTHEVIDISHPTFWIDMDGNSVKPFTRITHKQAKGRMYTVAVIQDENGKFKRVDESADDYNFDIHMKFHRGAVKYLEELESIGKSHIVWPIHCLSGSRGHAIYDPLMEAIKNWSITSSDPYKILQKGQFPFSEQYGAFEAEIPIAQVSETTRYSMLVQMLLQYLVGNSSHGYEDGMDVVYMFGQSKSHSVATTLEQIMDFSKDDPDFKRLMEILVVVEDCMSPIKQIENSSDKIFQEAKNRGIKFTKIEDIKL